MHNSTQHTSPRGHDLTEGYFAYGTDMDEDILRSKGVKPRYLGLARLGGYQLAFRGHSEIWDSGLETLVESPESEVWGALYSLTMLDWDRLDAWMGARLDGAGMYFHYPVMVTDSDGEPRHVRLYKKDILGPQVLPSREYLQLIVRGALKRMLPQAYIEKLQSMEARPASYGVPAAGNPHRSVYSPSDCRTCETGADEPLVAISRRPL
jgi:hypothetical protein